MKCKQFHSLCDDTNVNENLNKKLVIDIAKYNLINYFPCIYGHQIANAQLLHVLSTYHWL